MRNAIQLHQSLVISSSSFSWLPPIVCTFMHLQPPKRWQVTKSTNHSFSKWAKSSGGGRLVTAASNDDGKNAPDIPSVQETVAPSKDAPKMPYPFLTALGVVGFLETSYLTFTKLSGGSLACPLGAEGCADVLNSEYAFFQGVPLSVLGVLSYGAVAALALSGLKKGDQDDNNLRRWLLLGFTSAMAAASAYFMYVLTVKLEGASCTYCVSSALLSFSLLLATLPGFSSKEFRNVLALQLAIGASVIVSLSVGFANTNAYTNTAESRSASLDLPYLQPEVFTVSSPQDISLAKHLHSIGAKMYGAFWCSHCLEQKELFGREAMRYLDYVECYPEGYRKGVGLAKACEQVKIEGFPTWVIKGEVIAGELELPDLARMSGFVPVDVGNAQ